MTLQSFEVGKPIPALLTPYTHGPDGASLQLMEDLSLLLCVVLTDATSKEVQAIKKGLVRFRLLEQEDLIFPMVAFDHNVAEFELPFDPTGYKEDIPELANLLHIVLIDQRGLILKVNRVLGLGKNFLRRLVDGWNAARRKPEEFHLFVRMMEQNHVRSNWNNASPVDWDK